MTRPLRLVRAPGVAAAVALALAGCASRPAPPSGSAAASPAAKAAPASGPSALPIRMHAVAQGSKFVRLSKQVGNRKVYDLRATSETGQYLGGDSGRSEFVDPVVTFYQRSGGTIVARAPAGTIVEKDKTVAMSGGVTAKTDDGKTLTSDTLRYDDATQELDGNGNVTLKTADGGTMTGDAIEWNLRTGKLDVQGAR